MKRIAVLLLIALTLTGCATQSANHVYKETPPDVPVEHWQIDGTAYEPLDNIYIRINGKQVMVVEMGWLGQTGSASGVYKNRPVRCECAQQWNLLQETMVRCTVYVADEQAAVLALQHCC